MSDQPEALFLADVIENDPQSKAHHDAAAALLRRQHAEIESAHRAQREAENELSRALARHAMAETALKAECDALRAELVEHKAARNAYASEFPPDHEGKHAVGIILLNIRNLKSERDALRADAERYRWLREESAKNSDFYSGDARWMVSREQGGIGQNFFGDKIDVAIDAAREAGK